MLRDGWSGNIRSEVKFGIFFGLSDNRERCWDIDNARECYETALSLDEKQNIVLVRGAVPGANGSLVMLRKSVKATKQQQAQTTAEKK